MKGQAAVPEPSKITYKAFQAHDHGDGRPPIWTPLPDIQELDIGAALNSALASARTLAVAADPDAASAEFTVVAVAERNWATGTATVELTPVATWRKT